MLDSILSRYPQDPTSLVMILQDVQTVSGYLPAEALAEVARALDLPKSQVYAVAKFYGALSLEPRGEHLVRVCMGTACHVRQAPLVLGAVLRELGVEAGGTSADREFTVMSVGCVGACAIGPVVEIDEVHHGHMTATKVAKLLRSKGSAKGGNR